MHESLICSLLKFEYRSLILFSIILLKTKIFHRGGIWGQNSRACERSRHHMCGIWLVTKHSCNLDWTQWWGDIRVRNRKLCYKSGRIRHQYKDCNSHNKNCQIVHPFFRSSVQVQIEIGKVSCWFSWCCKGNDTLFLHFRYDIKSLTLISYN